MFSSHFHHSVTNTNLQSTTNNWYRKSRFSRHIDSEPSLIVISRTNEDRQPHGELAHFIARDYAKSLLPKGRNYPYSRASRARKQALRAMTTVHDACLHAHVVRRTLNKHVRAQSSQFRIPTPHPVHNRAHGNPPFQWFFSSINEQLIGTA